jgi:hypothetical protein
MKKAATLIVLAVFLAMILRDRCLIASPATPAILGADASRPNRLALLRNLQWEKYTLATVTSSR